MKLSDDVTRCDGKIGSEGLSAECLTCARRTAPRPWHFWMMNPPKFENGTCKERIEEK